jgi:hypothetical protein
MGWAVKLMLVIGSTISAAPGRRRREISSRSGDAAYARRTVVHRRIGVANDGEAKMSGPAAPPEGLGGLEGAVKRARGGPETWNPPFCGDLDIRIAADGTWFYMGSPIGRKPLVKLFSSVLRREGDKHFLVTPVEKIGITVDEAPFLAVEMRVAGEGEAQRLAFRTNVDDWVEAGPAHGLRFVPDARGAPRPYLDVRRGLEALVARAVYYDLVALGVERDGVFGVWSGGAFFPIAGMP